MQKVDYYARGGRGKRPKFAAFDFETEGLGGRVLAVSYMMEGESEAHYYTHGTELRIIQHIFDVMAENHKFTWYAHNAQYEFRYFTDLLLDHRENVRFFLRTDSDVFMLVVALPDYGEKVSIVMKDSFAIWDLSLKKVTETFCPDLPKMELDLENIQFDPKDPYHIAYAKRDSHALLLSLIRFNEIIRDTFDVNLHSTRAGTALAAWQRTLKSGERYFNAKEDEDFIRSAYYGGLVFLTSTLRHEGAQTYDINSSYPYQMLSHLMPKGKSVRIKRISRICLGIYDVTIIAPDNLIVPIIPKRDKKGIVWPRGLFRTTVTNYEIEFALKHGYRLVEVHDGRIWNDTCQPFLEFISKCVSIRMSNESGSTLDWSAKYMQNSLYGKFGAKRKRRKLYAHLSEDEMVGASMWGEFWIKEEYSDDMQCLPQWSVFITAHARLHLLRTIYAVGPSNVLYGDTDSITCRQGVEIGTGKEYGKWKLEKTWQEFRAHGPKVYAGHLESGKVQGAAKGIPRRTWEKSGIFDAILNSEDDKVVRYRTLEKFVVSLKTRYNGERDATRSLSSLGHSRSWAEQSNGDVRPRYWHEIEARERRLPDQAEGDIFQRSRAPLRRQSNG